MVNAYGGVMGVDPKTQVRMLVKRVPWSGFVKKSATILRVGQYVTVMIPRRMRSESQKYPISM